MQSNRQDNVCSRFLSEGEGETEIYGESPEESNESYKFKKRYQEGLRSWFESLLDEQKILRSSSCT
jgi:hypothetical protein